MATGLNNQRAALIKCEQDLWELYSEVHSYFKPYMQPCACTYTADSHVPVCMQNYTTSKNLHNAHAYLPD